jgi:hypothetical protein
VGDGESLHQAACSARSAVGLIALPLIETGTMRRLRAPNRTCAHFRSTVSACAAGRAPNSDTMKVVISAIERSLENPAA